MGMGSDPLDDPLGKPAMELSFQRCHNVRATIKATENQLLDFSCLYGCFNVYVCIVFFNIPCISPGMTGLNYYIMI